MPFGFYSETLKLVVLSIVCGIAIAWQSRISDENFIFGNERQTIVIYRLIGNDMPPLQGPMQTYLNTKYTLKYEPNFPRVQKRWILNRIWNDTNFDSMYNLLLGFGVHRRDILARCFDRAAYQKHGKTETLRICQTHFLFTHNFDNHVHRRFHD